MIETIKKPIDKLELLKQSLEKTFEIKNLDNNLAQGLVKERASLESLLAGTNMLPEMKDGALESATLEQKITPHTLIVTEQLFLKGLPELKKMRIEYASNEKMTKAIELSIAEHTEENVKEKNDGPLNFVMNHILPFARKQIIK